MNWDTQDAQALPELPQAVKHYRNGEVFYNLMVGDDIQLYRAVAPTLDCPHLLDGDAAIFKGEIVTTETSDDFQQIEFATLDGEQIATADIDGEVNSWGIVLQYVPRV